MKRLFFICYAVFFFLLASGPGLSWAGGIYYYKGQDGVYHFTNRPDSSRYRLFAFFKNYPEADRGEIMRLVRGSCRKHGVDSRLIQAVIQVESNFEPKAVSHKGAQGLMQIMPETQKDLGVQRPFDLNENIEAGVRYLKMQINRFGDHALALAAYNAGPEQVARYQGIPPFSETQAYVRKVLAIYKGLKGG